MVNELEILAALCANDELNPILGDMLNGRYTPSALSIRDTSNVSNDSPLAIDMGYLLTTAITNDCSENTLLILTLYPALVEFNHVLSAIFTWKRCKTCDDVLADTILCGYCSAVCGNFMESYVIDKLLDSYILCGDEVNKILAHILIHYTYQYSGTVSILIKTIIEKHSDLINLKWVVDQCDRRVCEGSCLNVIRRGTYYMKDDPITLATLITRRGVNIKIIKWFGPMLKKTKCAEITPTNLFNSDNKNLKFFISCGLPLETLVGCVRITNRRDTPNNVIPVLKAIDKVSDSLEYVMNMLLGNTLGKDGLPITLKDEVYVVRELLIDSISRRLRFIYTVN
jgi:hypothetical protein